MLHDSPKRSLTRDMIAFACGLIASAAAAFSAPPTEHHTAAASAKPAAAAVIKYAIVWADQRVSGPADIKFKLFAFFPQYNPKVAYDPNNPATSPLEPPLTKGGLPYMGNKSYDGMTAEQIFGFPDPELTNPKDTVGYGRAFNLPAHLPTDSGSAPPLLLNLATEPRPPDIAAIPAVQPPAQAAVGQAVPAQVAAATLLPAGPATASPTDHHTNTPTTIPGRQPVAQTQPALQAKADDPVNLKLASAFRAEDASHARANLSNLRPSR